MALDALLKRIERRVFALGAEGFCQHYPPLILYPDGTNEIEVPLHDCGRPRLKIVVSFANGSDRASTQRRLHAAREALAQVSARFPSAPTEYLRERTAAHFGLLETEL